MSDNFTPEQIASDREINGKASPGPWEFSMKPECQIQPHVQTVSPGGSRYTICTPVHSNQTTEDNMRLVARFRTRFPLALDEIERLQAESAAMSEALAKVSLCVDHVDFVNAREVVDSTLSDAVERGKKLLDLERRDTPVKATVLNGDLFYAKCGACRLPITTHEDQPNFCPNCGSKLEWK